MRLYLLLGSPHQLRRCPEKWRSGKFRPAANAPIRDEWLVAQKRLQATDMGMGWVGRVDMVRQDVDRVFGKGRSPAVLFAKAARIC
jgi:hypothetical protein